ncbi:NUDIX hydrolase [Spiroplasma endosymbiont of Phycita roborella]|uniref:NUDIX hydrolase n=1 Tax=Spiroplasma endosymbiont of Phycita roborella TaxID=3066311 RepID=UPI00313D5ED2
MNSKKIFRKQSLIQSKLKISKKQQIIKNKKEKLEKIILNINKVNWMKEQNEIFKKYFNNLKNDNCLKTFNNEKALDISIDNLFIKYELRNYSELANFVAEQHEYQISKKFQKEREEKKEEFIKLIKVGFMYGVEEPWCNNQGVAILPYVIKENKYYFLLVKELNTLYSEEPTWATITGGLEKYELIQTVINEMWEETGIDIIDKKDKINYCNTYYGNKSSTKKWNIFYIDLTDMNLDLNITYKGSGDGTEIEKNTFAKFFNYEEMESKCRDLFCLAICQKIFKNENQNKLSIQDNIEQINNQWISTDLRNQPSISKGTYRL